MRVVAVTGIRDLDPGSVPDVDLAVVEEARRAGEMRFGGARGSDTVALRAACGLDIERVVYVPFRLRDQPEDARHAVRTCASRIVEMRLVRERSSYRRRNEALLRGASLLLAFTDGIDTGGTAWTIRRARALGIPVSVVPVARATEARLAGADGPERWSAPVFWWRVYVSSTEGRDPDPTTQFILDLKSGVVSRARIDSYATLIAPYFKRHAELCGAEAIVPMPRRLPGEPSDLAPLADAVAERTGQRVLDRWLVRHAEPKEGFVAARRMRFGWQEHARTMRVAGGYRPSSVVLFDNVAAFGGTMRGAIETVRRDAPEVQTVGFAVLRSEVWKIRSGAVP